MSEHHQAQAEFRATQQAFDQAEAALIKQVLATRPEESLLRDKLVLTIQGLALVRSELMNLAQTGDIEAFAETTRKSLNP